MRRNGSFLGTYQNIIAPNNTIVTGPFPSGIYSINDVNTFVQQNSWEYSYFPLSYQNLIKNFYDLYGASSITYVYNYTQLYNAVQNASASVADQAIVLHRGTYEIGSSGLSLIADDGTNYSALLGDGGKPITFICAPGQVLLNWTSSSGSRDGPMYYFGNANSRVYGGYFKRDNGGNSIAYETSFTRQKTGAGAMGGSINNCIFKEVNANGNWSRNYGLTNTYSINYCSILVNENGTNDNSSSPDASWNNCTNNWAKGTGSTPWSGPENVSYNSDFTITGNTTDGVYAGTYAWYQPKILLSTAS
jgi:hypothetical protein